MNWAYKEAYRERGGHPDLLAQRMRQVAIVIGGIIEDVGEQAHPAVRELVLASLKSSGAALADAILMEAQREGDRHLGGPPPCSTCGGSGHVYDPEGNGVCPDCQGERVRRVAP